MARVKHSQEELADEEFRQEVRRCQGNLNCMSQRKLAERINMAQSTVSKKVSAPETITVAELRKIVAGIAPDPRSILLLVGYTRKDLMGL